MNDPVAVYHPDLSLKGKLRRRLVRLAHRRPARLTLTRPMVSFSFDDPPATATTTGAELLEARGLKGTYYVASALAERDGPMGRFAGADEMARVRKAGHEIACHTFAHLDCGQATSSEISADSDRNAEVLARIGVTPSTFAYPYGDVSLQAKQTLGHRFDLLRSLHHGLIEDGADLNQAPAVGVEGPHGEATALRWLAKARARKAWLILYTHDVADQPSAWGCTTAALARLMDKALADGFEVVTVAEGARRCAA